MSSTMQRFSMNSALLIAVLVAAVFTLWQFSIPASANSNVAIPPAKASLANPGDDMQTAVLAGGCFWGMEEVFQHVKGVTNVVSGYAGTTKEHANYQDSSSGSYGDAEAVRITYDPAQISYAQLLQIYFSVAHDPTQIDRQSPDTGPQYRSEVFAANRDQARVARAYIKQLDAARVYDKPIATKVSVGENFFMAENYHQDYAQKHPDSLYIRINDAPKVENLRKRFTQIYRERPVNLASAD